MARGGPRIRHEETAGGWLFSNCGRSQISPCVRSRAVRVSSAVSVAERALKRSHQRRRSLAGIESSHHVWHRRVHPELAASLSFIPTSTRPLPVHGGDHQASAYRIRMDVVRRSHQRFRCHDIAIVAAAGLPKVTFDLTIGLSLRRTLRQTLTRLQLLAEDRC